MKQSLFFFFLLFSIIPTLFPAVPRTMNYQGKLTDPSGVAIDDPDRKVAFLIYDNIVGGTLLWAETLTVNISKGLFDVQLGNARAINLNFADQYWMQLKVDQNDDGDVTDPTDEFLAPRMSLGASPYSFRAIYADSANLGPNGWSDAGPYIYPNNAPSLHIEDDGDLDLGGRDIERVDELSANSIDPVLKIDGELWRTWTLDMVGQRVEVVGEATTGGNGFFEVDLSQQTKGSNLWLFYRSVDNKSIIPFVTPQEPRCLFAKVEGSIFTVGSVEQSPNLRFSYRLSGIRNDFRDMSQETTNKRTKPTDTYIDIDGGAKYRNE